MSDLPSSEYSWGATVRGWTFVTDGVLFWRALFGSKRSRVVLYFGGRWLYAREIRRDDFYGWTIMGDFLSPGTKNAYHVCGITHFRKVDNTLIKKLWGQFEYTSRAIIIDPMGIIRKSAQKPKFAMESIHL